MFAVMAGFLLRPNLEGVSLSDLNVVDGYSVPVDPMDLLQCDSCQ